MTAPIPTPGARTVGWKRVQCYRCRGYGIVGYSDERECDRCQGLGYLWCTSRDRVALWPGGPFRGHFPGYYTDSKEVMQP